MRAMFNDILRKDRFTMMRVRNLLPKTAIIILAISVLILPACSTGEAPAGSQIDSYTIADSTGDWGYPSPYAHYSRGPGYTRMQFIFETLVWKNATDFVPQLAREWEYSENDNAYIFKLQENVKWHDGADFTADDVKVTGERIWTQERYFNQLHGFSRKDDVLPKRFFEEPSAKGEVYDRDAFERMLDEYYEKHKYNSDGTIPEETLRELGIL